MLMDGLQSAKVGDNYDRDILKAPYENDPKIVTTDPATVSMMINDSQTDAISKLAKDLNLKLSDDTKDYLYQYYLQRQNDEWAFAKQNQYDSTRYQRTVADLQKAGLNPFLALQSLSPSSSNVSSGSITSGSITSRRNTDKQANTDIGRGIMTVIGIIAAAIIGAML